MTPRPLRYRFRVSCPVERAFQLWTQSADLWWPMATHSVSGRRDAALVIEPGCRTAGVPRRQTGLLPGERVDILPGAEILDRAPHLDCEADPVWRLRVRVSR